jgi:hypothetical protein
MRLEGWASNRSPCFETRLRALLSMRSWVRLSNSKFQPALLNTGR